MKFAIWIYFVICACVFVIKPAFANEITILYTGDTHAMLYPCNCLQEPDGGVARRAALIKEIRKANPDALLLDGGGFFAGGLMDEYAQNTKMDMERSKVNLKAMEIMKYDAVAIGDDELNFGQGFLEENISKTKLSFLSCNLELGNVLPYIIKDVSGTKFGIIGLTVTSAKEKSAGLKISETKPAVKEALEGLKKQGAQIILLLSHQGEKEDLELLKEFPEINLLVTGHLMNKEEPATKVGDTIVLRPFWQGKRISKLILSVEDNKIKDYKVEELRLSDAIANDPGILAILPACFKDTNCMKKGYIGTCVEPGTLKSSCSFREAPRVNLTVIKPKDCVVCESETVTNALKGAFNNLQVIYLSYPEPRSVKLLKDLKINALPVYLLGKEAQQESAFNNLKEKVEKKGDYYMLKPQFSGIGYFTDRKNIKGKLDLFISLYEKDAGDVLEVLREFNPAVHFLALEKDNNFEAANGNLEAEEYLRGVCIQKYYPQNFWDYLSCRVKNINTSWWPECITGLDIGKIRTCAQGEEGRALLKDNIALNKELQVLFGPVYLVGNQEIFGSRGRPDKEILKGVINKK